MALMLAYSLDPLRYHGTSDWIFHIVGQHLRTAWWVLPISGAVAITLLMNKRIVRHLPQSSHQMLLAFFVIFGLFGLTAIFGPLLGLLVLVVVGAVALLVAWVFVLPRRIAPPLSSETLADLGERDRIELADARLKLQNDVRATALQTIAGAAVLAGAVLAFQQLSEDRQEATANQELTRQGQASERFTRAVDQLGSSRREVQLGGIYGLQQIALQAPDNRQAVTEVLTAYLHRRSPQVNSAAQAPGGLRFRAPDVQAVLTVLVRRAPPATDPPAELGLREFTTDPAMDLSRLDLRGSEISGEGVIFVGPERRIPQASEGSVQNAEFFGTDLRGALFEHVLLTGADFEEADLRGADFRGVDVESAEFSGALADTSTLWPEGFDWRAAGIKMM